MQGRSGSNELHNTFCGRNYLKPFVTSVSGVVRGLWYRLVRKVTPGSAYEVISRQQELHGIFLRINPTSLRNCTRMACSLISNVRKMYLHHLDIRGNLLKKYL
jgi:hypothetical protein